MDNCTYNKIKLMHELSRIAGFLERHGKKDAKSAKHTKCIEIMNNLHKDLLSYIDQLSAGISKRKI